MDNRRIENLPLCNKGGAYITVAGQNRKAFEIAKLEAKVELKMWSKQLLGNQMEQNRPTGAKGSGTITVYNATSVFREACHEYLENGTFPPISIQAYSDDKGSAVGRSEVLLRNVVLNEVPLMLIDEGSEEGSQSDIGILFSDYDVLSDFKLPSNY